MAILNLLIVTLVLMGCPSLPVLSVLGSLVAISESLREEERLCGSYRERRRGSLGVTDVGGIVLDDADLHHGKEASGASLKKVLNA